MKKSVILYIDTSMRDKVKVRLKIDGQKDNLKEISQNTKAQETLSAIEKILRENEYKLNDLTEIKVKTGPGSFIGLRVGISIASTLAYLLKIPINEQKPPILPIYE